MLLDRVLRDAPVVLFCRDACCGSLLDELVGESFPVVYGDDRVLLDEATVGLCPAAVQAIGVSGSSTARE